MLNEGPIARTIILSGFCPKHNQSTDQHIVSCLHETARADVGQPFGHELRAEWLRINGSIQIVRFH
jgi:hypothetical protein